MNKINALFVIENGPYYGVTDIIPWSEEENAFNCKNGAPAICHPPCKRWGGYWSGAPSVKVKKLKGDDDGCFAFSLWYVRTFGGIIEHPEASHAYSWFGLNRPPKKGGWIKADDFGGLCCCVEQGHYGHKARKATWLYINKVKPIKRLSEFERIATPDKFRYLLIKMVNINSKQRGRDGTRVTL